MLFEMEGSLTFQMRRIHNVVFKVANKMMHELDLPIKVEQVPILMCVHGADGISQQEIALMVHRDKSSVMRTIEAMKVRGLITVQCSKTDKRKNDVRVTETGKFLAQQLMEILRKAENEIFSAFEQEDKNETIAFMKKTADKLEQLKPTY